MPRYIVAVSRSGQVITGSVNFLYQDGRVAFIGRYTGKLAGSGNLTVTFADGKALTGTYAPGVMTLAACRSVLKWAVSPKYCQFSYHGNTP
jgi:prepilin-type processing-associated H-X9-DG protein